MSDRPREPRQPRQPTRLEALKRLAAEAHKTMLVYQGLEEKEKGLTDKEWDILDLARADFNALSSAIGLINSVNQWRLNEVRPKLVRVTPMQRKVLSQLRALLTRPNRGPDSDADSGPDSDKEGLNDD